MTAFAGLRRPQGPDASDAGASGPRFPAVILGTVAALLLCFGFGPNLDLAALALTTLAIGCIALRRPGEPPILLTAFGLQWLSASVAVFYANWLGIDINQYSTFGGDMRLATALSIIGLLFLALGMRVGAGAWRPREAQMARHIAFAHPVARWFRLYCAAGAASLLVLTAAAAIPGLAQIFLAAASLRWAFFFILAYASFARGTAGSYFLIAFCVELGVGLGTYFSDFRTVFFFTILAAMASGLRLNAKMRIGLGILVSGLLALSIVWTGIKQEYRSFVSEGRKEQVVAVDYATRLGKLAELTGALDARRVDAGIQDMLHRISYVEYFSVVLGIVPNQIAHEDGALFVDALTRPFLPRAFFPDKANIDDTERTNYYTGGLAGQSEGTSISIGSIAEFYIDFGAYGMMVALFGVGVWYGLVYRLLSRSRTCGSLVGMGLASAVLIPIGLLETSFSKVAGGLIACLIVTALLVRFVFPHALRWMTPPAAGR